MAQTTIEMSQQSFPSGLNTDSENEEAFSLATMNTARLAREHQFGRKLELAFNEGENFIAQYDPQDVLGTLCACKSRACPPLAYWCLTVSINVIWAVLGCGAVLGDWEYATSCLDKNTDAPFLSTCTSDTAVCWTQSGPNWVTTGGQADETVCQNAGGRWYPEKSGPSLDPAGVQFTSQSCAQTFQAAPRLQDNMEAWEKKYCEDTVKGKFLRERTTNYVGVHFGANKDNPFQMFKYSYVAFLISFLLVFRAQQAYAYYRKANEEWMKVQWNMWEAYQLMCAHIQNPVLVKKAGQHLIAFSVMLKCLLRQEIQPLADAEKELKPVLEPRDLKRLLKTEPRDLDKDGNVKRDVLVKHGHCAACLYVCRRIIEYGNSTNKDADNFNLGGMHVWALRRLSRLNESLCTMFMISSSPFPWTYMLHVRFMVLLWILLIPLEILKTGWSATGPKYEWPMMLVFTLLFSTVISYAIMGLEQIGNELQNPFGVDVSDLPMETFCKQNHENLNGTANVVYKVYGSAFEEDLAERLKRPAGARATDEVQQDSDDDAQ